MRAEEYLETLIQKYTEEVEEASGDVEYWDAADWAQQDVYEEILRELKALQNW